jgi:hypothetical protein
MTNDLVDVIVKDIKEVVEAEIKRFLDHYTECEVVDAVFSNWHFKVVKGNVIIHSLPCEITKYYILSRKRFHEVPMIECNIEYDGNDRDMLWGWVKIIWIGNKCFAEAYTGELDIHSTAEEIVREVVLEE